MKKGFLLILSFIFSLSCMSPTLTNNKKNDLERWELKGSVKFFEEKSYQFLYHLDLIDINEPNLERDFKLSFKTQVSFDEKGIAKEHITYDPEEINYRHIKSFNAQEIPQNEIIYNSDGEIEFFKEFNYNEHDNLVEEVRFHYDSTIYTRTTFAYDDLQLITEQVDYRYDKIMWTRIFQYDNKGRVEIETFKSTQNPSRRVHTYNRQGELASIIFHKPDGTIIEEDSYEYEKTQLIQKTKIDHLKNAKTIFHYNAEGFITKDERWTSKDGIETLKTRSAQYQYDDRGNWLRRDSYNEDKLTYIHLRKVEYY